MDVTTLDETMACNACGHMFTKPADQCPLCGEHLYWVLNTSWSPSASEETVFLTLMRRACGEEPTQKAYLVHDDHYWLPYNYWEKDPNGTLLKKFPWLTRIQLVQHDGVEEEDTTPFSEPTQPAEKLTRADEAIVIDDDAFGVDLPSETEMKASPTQDIAKAQPAPPAPTARSPINELELLEDPPPRSHRPREPLRPAPPTNHLTAKKLSRLALPSYAHPPIAITLFLIFLTICYFVLQYHRYHN